MKVKVHALFYKRDDGEGTNICVQIVHFFVGCYVLVMQILLSGKTPKHIVMLLPLQGATAPTRGTQGAATLALGYGLHWAFSPPLQKYFYHIAISNEVLYCSFGIASPLRIDK